jgi:hypothetical protein
MSKIRLDLLLTICFLLGFQALNFGHELSHDLDHEHQSQPCHICLSHINNEIYDGNNYSLNITEYSLHLPIIFHQNIKIDDILINSKSRSPPFFMV